MPIPIIYPQLDGIQVNENRTLPGALVQAIRKVYDYVAQLDLTISSTPAVTSGLNAISTTRVLTAAATINSPGTPADGALWAVRVDQDATGGWPVTWGTGIALAPFITATINSDPSTMCIVLFVGFNGTWLPSSTPILGVPVI